MLLTAVRSVKLSLMDDSAVLTDVPMKITTRSPVVCVKAISNVVDAVVLTSSVRAATVGAAMLLSQPFMQNRGGKTKPIKAVKTTRPYPF